MREKGYSTRSADCCATEIRSEVQIAVNEITEGEMLEVKLAELSETSLKANRKRDPSRPATKPMRTMVREFGCTGRAKRPGRRQR